MPPAPDVQSNY